MSTNYIILIPTDPYYVPEPAAQKAAFAAFESLVPGADEVQLALKEEVQFIDAGEYWSGAFCPACGTELSRFRWERLRRRAEKRHYADLTATMPCCGARCSLNELQFPWPVGFAHFALEARDANIPELSAEQVAMLVRILRCRLRQVWAHY